MRSWPEPWRLYEAPEGPSLSGGDYLVFEANGIWCQVSCSGAVMS